MQLESTSDRIAGWIRLARTGDENAVRLLWLHCFSKVTAFARKRLGGVRLTFADEEDIALSAMKSLCLGLRNGRYEQLDDQASLWRLLLVITSRKVVDQIEYSSRQKRDINRIASPDGDRDLAHAMLSRAPTPDQETLLCDELDGLLTALGNQDLCQIVLQKLDGYTNLEISKRMDCSLTTIERKLRVIRSIWNQVQRDP